MITRSGGLFYLVCDVCGETTEEDFAEFQDAVDAKKTNGWDSQKISSQWEDICPECQEAS